MRRALLYTMLAVVVLAGLATAYRPARDRVRQIATNLKLIRGDTGDVMASATYQRYAVRRQAVDSMRAALLDLVAVESAFVADSGRPLTRFTSGYYGYVYRPATDVYVTIQRDRWVAQARNRHTSLSCSLTAMVIDTSATVWTYRPGQPICADWNAESTAVASGPAATTSAVVEQPAPATPQRTPSARPHREWGPVNNTPPRMPYIVKDACEGEGCITSGRWAACADIVALREERRDAPPVFTIHAGERFTAVTSDLHVEAPGIVVFRHPMITPPNENGDADSIAFTPADTLYILNQQGEGYVTWWFRGRAAPGYQFWDYDGSPDFVPSATDTAALVRPPRTVWWVKVRRPQGQEGWIVGSYDKFATGGYMDEIDRCLHTTKG